MLLDLQLVILITFPAHKHLLTKIETEMKQQLITYCNNNWEFLIFQDC